LPKLYLKPTLDIQMIDSSSIRGRQRQKRWSIQLHSSRAGDLANKIYALCSKGSPDLAFWLRDDAFFRGGSFYRELCCFKQISSKVNPKA
jgi:hypothetical protein